MSYIRTERVYNTSLLSELMRSNTVMNYNNQAFEVLRKLSVVAELDDTASSSDSS